ncbi:MAG: NTP transferase domain-containing protein [bacterium]|nr:NTP transferase domain-containing protein [bacterium]
MNPTHATTAGLIMAGGQGRRWGGPKAWAQLPDGRTFLQACSSALVTAGVSPILATLPPGSSAPGIAELETLALPEDGLDMFASLRLGLERLLSLGDWQMVVMNPVDHPLVSSLTIQALISAEAPAAIATVHGKHGHPICIARSTAENVVSNPDSGPTLRHVLRRAGAIDVAVEDFGAISNCNTPEMLASHLTRL